MMHEGTLSDYDDFCIYHVWNDKTNNKVNNNASKGGQCSMSVAMSLWTIRA